MAEMIVSADFSRIAELGNYLRGLIRVLGVDTVRVLYAFDSEHIDGDVESYDVLGGFDVTVQEMYERYIDTGLLFPYKRLGGLDRQDVVKAIKSWMASSGQDLNSATSKDAFLDKLGGLCGENIDPAIRLKALSLFGQAAGFITNAQVNIDASQKTIVAELEKRDDAAKQIVSRVNSAKVIDR